MARPDGEYPNSSERRCTLKSFGMSVLYIYTATDCHHFSPAFESKNRLKSL
jgi:hypothetical protein